MLRIVGRIVRYKGNSNAFTRSSGSWASNSKKDFRRYYVSKIDNNRAVINLIDKKGIYGESGIVENISKLTLVDDNQLSNVAVAPAEQGGSENNSKPMILTPEEQDQVDLTALLAGLDGSEKPFLGRWVRYTPTLDIFGTSTGSWTNKAAKKLRRCLVYKISNGRVFLKPMTGAKEQPDGTWSPPKDKEGHSLYWDPVKYSDPAIPTPPPTKRPDGTQSDTILVNVPNGDKALKLKPSYIWARDDGESISLLEFTKLEFVPKDKILCRQDQLAKLEISSKSWVFTPPPKEDL